MAKKKVTRKQLLKQPDEFISFSNRIIGLGVEYKQSLMISMGVLCVMILVYVGIQFVSQRSRAQAFTLLGDAVTRYELENIKNGPEKAYAAVDAELELLLRKYGSNAVGRLARVTFAQYNYAAGHLDRAIALYDEARADFDMDSLYRGLIDSGLGYAYTARGDLHKAIVHFEQVAFGPVIGLQSDALFNLGLLYDRTGQLAKSAAAFKQIKEEHAASFYAKIANEKIDR